MLWWVEITLVSLEGRKGALFLKLVKNNVGGVNTLRVFVLE